MKKIGKILAALTAATLCVGALPAVQVALPRVSIAASAESADGLTYQLINDSTEVAITGCDDVTSVTVPSEIEGKPVTTIAERALSSKSKLLKVTLPDSVTTIESRAFNDCSHLRSVDMGNGVKTIGTFAFSGCNELTSITLSENLTEIGESAFNQCSALTELALLSLIHISEPTRP